MQTPRLLVSVPDDRLRDALGELPASVEVIVWDMKNAAPHDAIDIVVPPYLSLVSSLAHLRDVATRLVQSQSIGYDGIAGVLPPGHVFANAVGVHETSTSELALALILASQRAIPGFVRAQGRGTWSPVWTESLADRSILLVGCGGVGAAIEARLAPFEVIVTRVAKHARTDERGFIHDLSSLPALLANSEIVVVAVPLTDETTHLIDDSFLTSMPDGSLLVNVSRGRVADTQALIAHASTGRLRLALDVTDPEPLPDGHPLFNLENVLITPHVGGASSAMLPRIVTLVRRQIERMQSGLEPLHVVLRT